MKTSCNCRARDKYLLARTDRVSYFTKTIERDKKCGTFQNMKWHILFTTRLWTIVSSHKNLPLEIHLLQDILENGSTWEIICLQHRGGADNLERTKQIILFVLYYTHLMSLSQNSACKFYAHFRQFACIFLHAPACIFIFHARKLRVTRA